MSSFTPFSFSSKRLQEQTVGLLRSVTGGSGSGSLFSAAGGVAADVLAEMLAWYEMWINPEKIDLNNTYIQTTKPTAGSMVTFHYRRKNIDMNVSGQSGWILNPSADEAGQYSAKSSALLKGGNIGSAITNAAQGVAIQAGLTNGTDSQINKNISKKYGAARTKNSRDNSARKFISRLRDIAEEPMYYVDMDGIEHYNVKYIKIYTKQFPQGVICEGFYKSFVINESSEDKQTIPYSFTFEIENLKPISEAQRILSKKAGQLTGTGSAIRGVTGGLF